MENVWDFEVLKKSEKKRKKFGDKEKVRIFAVPNEKRGSTKGRSSYKDWLRRPSGRQFFKKSEKKFASSKKSLTFATPFEKGFKKDLWKTGRKQVQASTEKTRNREALIPYGIEKRQDGLEIYIEIYNEEFDPGSGWTLAAGLTHASRGAAWELAITFDGDRRKGA